MGFQQKKIFIVGGTLQQGGAERIMSVLSSEFLYYFSEVKIILWREAPIFYSIPDKIEVVEIPTASGQKRLVAQMAWFRKYVKRTKPTVVLSFLAPFNMLSLLTLFGLKVPVYIASRSDPFYDAPNRMWRWIRDFIYSFASGICVQSEKNKKSFPAYLQQKIGAIYNPVFVSSNLIGRAYMTEKVPVIVSVGRLSKVKNQIMLFEVFKELHEEYPDYRLVIYGEGEYRQELEKKIHELRLDGFIHLPGACKDVLLKILSAEIFVMTSNYEGMSNALIEAMALGLPVISTRVSGAVDLIQNNVNGKLVAVGDKNELKTALKDWLDNKDKAKQCAIKATKLANRLKIDVIVQQWLKFMSID